MLVRAVRPYVGSDETGSTYPVCAAQLRVRCAMIAALLGLLLSAAAILFGAAQLRRGDRTNGRLAIALGIVGAIFNAYAILRGL